MRKLMFAVLTFLMTMFSFSGLAKADEGCSASVFLRDWQDGFKTNIEAFDYCFTRVKWWKLDQSNGWKERYCHLGSYQYNGYQYFSMLFFHKDRTYTNAQYTESIFYALNSDYSGKVGRGWPANLELQFSKTCGHYDD